MQEAKEGWLRWIDEGGTGIYEWSTGEPLTYNFDTLSGWAAFFRNPSGDNLLIILGDGGFRASGSIVVYPNGRYWALFTYYVADVFHDPNPLNQYDPFSTSSDWEGCTPYVMEGEWSYMTTGSFKE